MNFDDAKVSKYGRYVDDATGTFETWSGTWFRFKVSGTTQIQLVTQVNLTSGAAGQLSINLDNGQYNGCTNDDSIAAASKTSYHEETITICTGISTAEHTVLIKTADYIAHSGLTTSEYIKIKQVKIDDGGTFSAWAQTGAVNLLILGDSWAGAWGDIPRLMNIGLWNIWPVGFGGFTAANMVTYYPYKKQSTAHTDSTPDVVLIQLGVNDYAQSVSTSTFKTNIQSIITLVRADHTNVPIFLLQMPRNINISYPNFDQYGTVLSQLATENTYTYYITTSTLWASLTWDGYYHLDWAGRNILAEFLNDEIGKYYFAKANIGSGGTMNLGSGGTINLGY
jgi:lysophospholipase L1-like esterase